MDKLARNKDIASVIQSWVTVIALFVGGAWTYTIFFSQRTSAERLQVATRLDVTNFTTGRRLLIVEGTVQNTGTVMARLSSGRVGVKQILPLPPQAGLPIGPIYTVGDVERWHYELSDTHPWNGVKVVEPGETDQIRSEFVLPCEVQVASVYVFVAKDSETTKFWQFWKTSDTHQAGWLSMSTIDFKTHPVESCKPAKNTMSGRSTSRK